MGDTATTVVDHDDGTYTKKITAEVVKEDLVDALTNMLHVQAEALPYDVDETTEFDFEVSGPLFIEEAWQTALGHFRAEVAGEDGVRVEVIE